MIYFKEHSTPKGMVLAACDSELLNKVLEEKQLSISVNDSFYGSKKIQEEEFASLLNKHDNINLVGNKVVEIAIKEGKVKNYSVIQGVKIALVFSI